MLTTSSQAPAYLPDRDKLSVVTAALVVALLSGHFIHLPGKTLTLNLPGLVVAVPLTVTSALALLIAALTAAGTDWILSDHPSLKTRTTLAHWLLPALTAWVLEVLLQRLPGGWAWWLTLFLGLAVWFSVLVAEYITVDANDLRYPLAAAVLVGLGFLLFFLLAVAVRAAGWRLLFAAPTLALSAGVVALRTLHLHLAGRWQPVEAVFIAALVLQLAAAAHHLPLSPAAVALFLTGSAYAATVYLGNLLEGEPWSQAIVEPLVVFGLTLLLMPWAW